MALLTTSDVLQFKPDADNGLVAVLVDEVCALARVRIPELVDEVNLTDDQRAAVRMRLRLAVIRYLESGDGSVTSYTESAPGGYSRSETVTTSGRRGILTDFDVEELQKILGTTTRAVDRHAFSLARSGITPTAGHDDGCAVYWGGPCDCTVGYPPDSPVRLPYPWVWVP